MGRVKEAPQIDGIYVAYFTGAMGSSFAMFVFKDGNIAGADAGGGKYDGEYVTSSDGLSILGKVEFRLPVGNQSITGFSAEKAPINISVPIALPTDIVPTNIHRIETPIGPINARFEKLRSL